MATRDELENLSSAELHDRATKHALKHGHFKFLWNLVRAMPAAEASVGEIDEARSDIQSIYGHINDLRTGRDGDVADLLRPMYIEYLLDHQNA